LSIRQANTTQGGYVQLYNGVDGGGVANSAATPAAVKTAYDVAAAALPLAGGTMTGGITFNAGQTFPGTLPLAGGTMTGDITFSGTQTFPGVVVSVGAGAGILAGGTATNPVISATTATTSALGVVQPDGTTITINGSGVISAVASGNFLPLSGGTLTGAFQITDGTFNYIQFYPDGRAYMEGPVGINVVPDPAFPLTLEGDSRSFGNDLLSVLDNTGGTAGTLAIRQSGVLSTSIQDAVTGPTVFMTHTAGKDLILGASGVQYLNISGTDGQITVNSSTAGAFTLPTSQGAAGQVLQSDGAGNTIWAANVSSGALQLTGGTMTGAITFAAGQTISGYIANSLLTTTGDIIYASSANTPARLGLGAAGTILAVNGGAPAWRTSTQLGLLTSAAAASTYAPLNSPTFTGPITVNAGGAAGSNAFIVSGGSLVLSTSFTPASSGDIGSTGELAWDANYLYICTAPNTWGRIAIDSTPF
jgi:hypothetical protein